MSYSLPLPGSLMVGEKGAAQNIDSIRYAVVSVPTTTISAAAALITVSVAGVDAVRDQAILLKAPEAAASAQAVHAQVSGTNAIVVTYVNAGATNAVAGGSYTFMVLRSSIGGA